jgi:hypothetical protein
LDLCSSFSSPVFIEFPAPVFLSLGALFNNALLVRLLGFFVCATVLLLLIFLLLYQFTLIGGSQLTFQVADLFLKPVHFDSEAHQIFENLASASYLVLPFESIAKGKIRIDVLRIFLNRKLKGLDGFVVLGANIEQNSGVVENDRVGRVKLNSLFVVV